MYLCICARILSLSNTSSTSYPCSRTFSFPTTRSPNPRLQAEAKLKALQDRYEGENESLLTELKNIWEHRLEHFDQEFKTVRSAAAALYTPAIAVTTVQIHVQEQQQLYWKKYTRSKILKPQPPAPVQLCCSYCLSADSPSN